MTKWLPGVRPDLSNEQALERFGRAIGQLSVVLGQVPRQDAPHDWLICPHVHPDAKDVAELCRKLVAACMQLRTDQARDNLRTGLVADRASAGLPVQIVHGDVGASNVLADERTGAVTAILDFEIAGAELRVQDLVVGLTHSGALDAPDWQRRAAALARGYCGARELTEAEATAVPDLLLARAMGTVLWRAGRWCRGQASLDDVSVRLRLLAAANVWLAAHGSELRDVLRHASAKQTGGPAMRYPAHVSCVAVTPDVNDSAVTGGDPGLYSTSTKMPVTITALRAALTVFPNGAPWRKHDGRWVPCPGCAQRARERPFGL